MKEFDIPNELEDFGSREVVEQQVGEYAVEEVDTVWEVGACSYSYVWLVVLFVPEKAIDPRFAVRTH